MSLYVLLVDLVRRLQISEKDKNRILVLLFVKRSLFQKPLCEIEGVFEQLNTKQRDKPFLRVLQRVARISEICIPFEMFQELLGIAMGTPRRHLSLAALVVVLRGCSASDPWSYALWMAALAPLQKFFAEDILGQLMFFEPEFR